MLHIKGIKHTELKYHINYESSNRCVAAHAIDFSSVSQGALMSSSSPLVLPAVSWPASSAVIGQLQDQLETSPLYMDPETLSQLRLNASSPALLVFRLPYGIG